MPKIPCKVHDEGEKDGFCGKVNYVWETWKEMSRIQGKGGTYWIKMGETSRFGRALQRSMDHTKRVRIEGVFTNLGGYIRWQLNVQVWGKKIVNDRYSFMNNLHFL
jgi:hypothetical protein